MYLDRIVATKKEEVEHLKSQFSLGQAEKNISQLPDTKGFRRKLMKDGRNRSLGLIAEVKKASPSKGLIRADFDPVLLAVQYEEAQADCISVLTDEQYFQGSAQYLQAIREAVRVPLLRKDFTIDYRQVYEARLLGADAVLLIAAILSKDEMKELLALSRDLGMDTLVEVHDRRELETVLELDADLVGINNRNLKTFVTDLKTTEELIAYIPQETVIVSESGISKGEEIAYLSSLGADAVLVGETFMRRADVKEAVSSLMGLPAEKGLGHDR
ncbi:indole-3-glycerol phosphate synthase TrpC [Paenibacillus senegalensis]|uniref:indole-3-glycerol phosphate synthase TrpC n=1 Tax=Paenibacillus senegalensis TaxID=1465766 RepID=UPI0002886B49|nr:indole-3-glycerol phosphate synthase TrpC [Paenibacillus senegalensis]